MREQYDGPLSSLSEALRRLGVAYGGGVVLWGAGRCQQCNKSRLRALFMDRDCFSYESVGKVDDGSSNHGTFSS
jgi:hypothetical protein